MEASMVTKSILALACALFAAPAFAQTIEERYYPPAPAMTTSEQVIVTAPPTIQAQEGTAAAYQPAGTLVVRTDNANSERFDSFGPGLVYDKFGRAIRSPVKPGARVVVFYTNNGYTRLVDHIVVLD
jgi:hypothetical protein